MDFKIKMVNRDLCRLYTTKKQSFCDCVLILIDITANENTQILV